MVAVVVVVVEEEEEGPHLYYQYCPQMTVVWEVC